MLIALFDERHVHHFDSHAWWKANRNEGWASCPLTQNGFVRIVSQPKYPRPVLPREAIRHLTQTVERTDHESWPDDVSLLRETEFDPSAITRSKHITDIYLLALAVRHSGRLITFDRHIPLSAVVGANNEHLSVISAGENHESS